MLAPKSGITSMSTRILFLYSTTVLIWGSTWLAIKFQLGEVDPIISVFYRMALSSALLFCYCRWQKIPVRLSKNNHRFMVLQGLTLFGINYWLVYWSEVYLASGVVAVLFSMLVFFNIFNSWVFLGRRLSGAKLAGAVVGLTGVCALFYPELKNTDTSGDALLGLGLGLSATTIASIGNIVATRNSGSGLSIWVVNAWGMGYGSFALLIIALVSGIEFGYPSDAAYSLSLVYLTVFGTILAFGAYLKLLNEIGPDSAAYSSMLFPVVALLLSSIFEGYSWTLTAIIGLLLIGVGNILVMRK